MKKIIKTVKMVILFIHEVLLFSSIVFAYIGIILGNIISMVFNIPVFMLEMFMLLIYYISNRDKADAKSFFIEVYDLAFGRFIKYISDEFKD